MSWESQGIALLAASLLRPFALAAAAWLILKVLRVRHPASRHAVWTAVLSGMVLLPMMSVMTPHWKLPVLNRRPNPGAATAGSGAVNDSGLLNPMTPYPAEGVNPAPGVLESHAAETLILGGYFAGLFAMVTYRAIGWVLLWRVMARSRPLRGPHLRESADVLTPVAVGVLRPAVIVPTNWRVWSAATRRAVLAHEFAHLRRHDGLISALGRSVRCLLWFHPLAWWVSREISELAELACDAAVLERGDDPAGYARILVEFADRVNRAGQRVAWPGMAMASGSGMSRRIDQLFELSGGLSRGTLRKLSRPGAWLALIGVPVMCLAATIGLSESSAQSPAQSAAPMPPRPQFEVASVKPCKDSFPAGGRNGGDKSSSPGRMERRCQTLAGMIMEAYVMNAGGRSHPMWTAREVTVEGGPSWIHSERYDIEAKADNQVSRTVMNGPMLQALLEDRFKLKIRRATREIPVYELTVAKGGPKLQPFVEGSCGAWDFSSMEPMAAAGQKPCPLQRNRKGPIVIENAQGLTLEMFCKMSLDLFDRRVIDKTGLTGRFDFHLEYTPDETMRGFQAGGDNATDPPGPSIFQALQKLGLKLEPGKGQGEYFVIDHVERPT